MDTNIKNADGFVTSLQVSNIMDIPSGDTKFKRPCLIKNITEFSITCTVILINGDEIETVFYPGWNPEIITGVKDVEAGCLQCGY